MEMTTKIYLEKERTNIKKQFWKNFFKNFIGMFLFCAILMTCFMYILMPTLTGQPLFEMKHLDVFAITFASVICYMSLLFATVTKYTVLNKYKFEKEQVNIYDAMKFLVESKASKKMTADHIKNTTDKMYEGYLLEVLNDIRNATEDMSDYAEKKMMVEKEFANKTVVMDTRKVFMKLNGR